MTPEEILKSTNVFLKNEMIGEVSSAIGYIKEFRWSWLGTQLNTFIVIGETEQSIRLDTIAKFSGDAFQFALKNNKGWPRGLQSGVGSIAILIGPDVDSSAVQFCESFSKKHWSAFEIPVVFDTSTNKLSMHTSSPAWGSLYVPYFTRKIMDLYDLLRVPTIPK